jgi:hypothetical protein
VRRMTGRRSGCLRAEWCLKWVRACAASGLVIASLALPPVALGASSPVAGYSRPGGAEQTDVASRKASSTRSVSGELPFTGLDLWWLAGGGAVLFGFGLLLAALARGGGVSARQATVRDGSGVTPVSDRETKARYSLR